MRLPGLVTAIVFVFSLTGQGEAGSFVFDPDAGSIEPLLAVFSDNDPGALDSHLKDFDFSESAHQAAPQPHLFDGRQATRAYAIPIPTTGPLLAAACVALACLRRRRRSALAV